jgi:oligopeptide/dipeptide ABC transporter ATP-binding protein
MYLGRIVEQGHADEIFRRPMHPYTEALVRGVPQPDPDRRRQTAAISGEVPSLLNRPKGCDFATRCPYAQSRCHDVSPDHETHDGRTVACHYPLAG